MNIDLVGHDAQPATLYRDPYAAIPDDDESILKRSLDNVLCARAACIWGASERDIEVRRELWRVVPSYFRTYFEPIFGRSHFLWASCHNRAWTRAVIGDVDPGLIELYHALRDSHEEVLERLDALPVPGLRHRSPFTFGNADDVPGKVAQIIRTGSWLDVREQLDKQLRRRFEKHVRMVERNRVQDCSDVLNEFPIEILCQDFERTLAPATAGDFVFLDVPTAFSLEEHARAAACFRSLTERGIVCAAAIPAREEIARLYIGFEIRQVFGPLPEPKRRPRKTKSTVESVNVPQRPMLAQVIVGKRK